MYVDNVVVESVMTAGTEEHGATQATKISFDIFEPYSMNGFIETLQVTSQAGGWGNYINCVYAFRVRFIGYNDKEQLPTPEVVPKSTRFFLITITNVAVEVTEEGTVYKVESTPVDQMAYGETGKLRSDVSSVGNTVGEMLVDLFDKINLNCQKDAERMGQERNQCDTYQISVPKFVTSGKQDIKAAILTTGNLNNPNCHAMVSSEFDHNERSDGFSGHATPDGYPQSPTEETPSPSGSKLPTTQTEKKVLSATFKPQEGIHECIAAIIRDSSYVRNLVSDDSVRAAKNGDGMVEYFTTRVVTETTDVYINSAQKFLRNFIYVVEPYKIHYTTIPGYKNEEINAGQLLRRVKREYNYIYTGDNVDVIKFSLNFNNLYFDAIPKTMGNKPDNTDMTTFRDGTGKVVLPSDSGEVPVAKNILPIQVKQDPASSDGMMGKAAAGVPQSKPYYYMARMFHQAVMEGTSMLTGTIDILGDPYFLVTGGMGNIDTVITEEGTTADGQAANSQGDTFIKISFKNPVDFNANGEANFQSDILMPFSGVYQITLLKSIMKDGLFSQTFELIRVPGQQSMVGRKDPVQADSVPWTSVSDPNNIPTVDTAPVGILKSGIKENLIDPLVLSGVAPTSTLGVRGLSSVQNMSIPAISGMSPVSGLLKEALKSGVNPVDQTNNIAQALTTPTSSPAALVASAGVIMKDVSGSSSAVAGVAANVGGQLTNLSNTLDGKGNSLTQGQAEAVKAVLGVAASSGGLVGNVSDSVSKLVSGSPSELVTASSKLGIDFSSLSRLSSNLQSNVSTQLKELAKNVPQNTDVKALLASGVSLGVLSPSTISNLPAVQPINLSKIYDSMKSVSQGATGVPTSAILSGVQSLPGAAGVGNQISGALQQVNVAMGVTLGVANNVGALSQNVLGSLNPATLGLGSVESISTVVPSWIQGQTSPTNMSQSAVSKYGSAMDPSPLAAFVSGG